jgi:hypothetical protein
MSRIERLAKQIEQSENASNAKPAKLSYGGTDVFEFEMPGDSVR